ncbi:predicted protein [Naegleria gruberi]|uniref:Predicted protein n=1 Tax=Naegleria gruberi TaxID=5762 RepID=D2UXV7_NAEGR|nr:uncharacterized protein NAEGRDRAFT_61256 [Naegleria gruberi]EFC50355.1 predicted protein [Naegleria gruberi]|eukprot:XP_002683099.1 predicted protein [Naegleria gruberi strain NEG-M]
MPKPKSSTALTQLNVLDEVKEEKAIDRILKIIDNAPSLGYINKTQFYTMVHFLEKEASVKDKQLKLKVEETKACREIIQKLKNNLKQNETDIKMINNNRSRIQIAIEMLKVKTEEIRRESDVVMESILDYRRNILDLENYSKQQAEFIKETQKETKNYIKTNQELDQIKNTALKERFIKANEKEKSLNRFLRHITIVRKNLTHDPYQFFGSDQSERDDIVFGNNFGANAKEKFKRRNSVY